MTPVPSTACETPGHGERPAPIPSELLLRGQRVVEIRHNGQLYRLQSTSQGKLILTK